MDSVIKGRVVSYHNDLQRSYMVVKMLEGDSIAEYQIRMIRENPTEQLLSLYKKHIDKDIYIYFDITSKITLNQLLRRIKFSKHKFLSVLKSLMKAIALGKQYLLHSGGFVLHGDYIYVDPASLELSVAYLPMELDVDINHEVKTLIMDLLIYKVSFETPDDGDFVYELLSSINRDDFNLNQLEQIISNIVLQRKQEGTKSPEMNHELLQKGFEAKTINVRTGFVQSNFKIMLLQLSFAAVAVLLSKYFYFQSKEMEITTLVGILAIVIALDVLCTTRIYRSTRLDSDEKKTFKKNVNQNQVLTSMKCKDANKGNILKEVKNKALVESAKVKAHEDPKDLETRFIKDEIPKLACLIGCGKSDKERIVIDKPSFVIGRIKSQCDYVTSNGTVGKLHAEIINRDGNYYIKDLNSRNGTFINGERILSNNEHLIQSNNIIAFADSEYKFLWR